MNAKLIPSTLNRYILATCTLAAFIIHVNLLTAQDLKSIDVLYGIELESYLDNREFDNIPNASYPTGTEFAARFMPTIGLGFAPGNSLHFGANIYLPFGANDGIYNRYLPQNDIPDEEPKEQSNIYPVAYYAFEGSKWHAAAGIFPRSMMHTETFSTAFFSDNYLFYNPLISGILGQYNAQGGSFIELACDWQGQRSQYTREKFTLLSAARKYWDYIYIGYNFALTHYAAQDYLPIKNVVDNNLVAPCIGVELNGTYTFTAQAAFLQSAQRDRRYNSDWLTPHSGELILKLSRWGVTIDERLYLGDNLVPLYNGHTVTLDDGQEYNVTYAEQLYSCSGFYHDNGGYYSRTSLNYHRRFYNDIVGVRVEFVSHMIESGIALEQIVDIDVKLGGKAYNAKKNKQNIL